MGVGSVGGPRSMWSRFTERRRRRVQMEREWSEREQQHAALVEILSAVADYDSYEAFYSTNEDRRGDDIAVGEVADRELCWTIRWLPRTTEVVAFPVRWINDQAHQVRTSAYVGIGSVGNSAGVGSAAVMTAALPPLVIVLGHANTANDAQERISSATTLDTLRSALRG